MTGLGTMSLSPKSCARTPRDPLDICTQTGADGASGNGSSVAAMGAHRKKSWLLQPYVPMGLGSG